LAVTATDVAALAGTYIKTCKRNYWAKPLLNELMHETGLRILIRKIQLIGAQYDKALTPIYSHSSNHYLRIYFVSQKGRIKADKLIKEHKYMQHCPKCFSTEVVDMVKSNCKHKIDYAGPLWVGPLWDKKLAAKMLKKADEENKELYTIVKTISAESKINKLGFYDVHKASKLLKKTVPRRQDILDALKKLKYKASETHFTHDGIRTNAPAKKFLSIIKKLR